MSKRKPKASTASTASTPKAKATTKKRTTKPKQSKKPKKLKPLTPDQQADFIPILPGSVHLQVKEILPESWVDSCYLCMCDENEKKPNRVGVIRYTRKDHRGYGKDENEVFTHDMGVATCLGDRLRICGKCEDQLKKVRNAIPSPYNPVTKKLEREYKKFLDGKLYPEIECVHTVGKWRVWVPDLDSGKRGKGEYVEAERKGEVMIAKTRLKTNKIFKV